MVRSALIGLTLTLAANAAGAGPVWPPAPDRARVEWVGEVRVDELSQDGGFLGAIRDVIGGKDDRRPRFPFDIAVGEESLFLTCQDLPALVEVDPESGRYRLHESDGAALRHPIAVCRMGDAIFVSDSGSGTVHRFRDGKLRPFVTAGLVRPTGLAALTGPDRLFVVDTGDHSVKIFDAEGRMTGRIEAGAGLHYPTFATVDGGDLLVNDSLNFRIKRFDAGGQLLGGFGEEGDGPGTFARPKGIAVDAAGRILVVDTLFDNLQIFDRDGQVLLVVGSSGQQAGQFWSPGGIDVSGDLIYVADTHNRRIQILRTLEDG